MATANATEVLVCPCCNWSGKGEGKHDGWFRLIRPVVWEYRVECVGRLVATEAIELIDDGDARLRCGNCLDEFPIPSGMCVHLE